MISLIIIVIVCILLVIGEDIRDQVFKNMSEEERLIYRYQRGEISYKEFQEAMAELHEDRNNQ